MKNLHELYEFLEKKKDLKNIDKVFQENNFSLDEEEELKLETLCWRDIDYIIENNIYSINREKAINYFLKRSEETNNKLLKYRYSYFLYRLSSNNRHAKNAIDNLISCISELLLEFNDRIYVEKTLDIILNLSKKNKYKRNEVTELFWNMMDSDCEYRFKILFIERVKNNEFIASSDAERIVRKCHELTSIAIENWKNKCCELGIFYASKLGAEGKEHIAFFNETLGDMEMEYIIDIFPDPNNICLPHLNDYHLKNAMCYYKKANSKDKYKVAENQYTANKMHLKYISFANKIEISKEITDHFKSLKEKLLNGKISILMMNLAMPDDFLFPSLSFLRGQYTKESPNKNFELKNEIADINGNTWLSKDDSIAEQTYGIWLNLVQRYILDIILTAVDKKIITYARLKSWFLNETYFGFPHKYKRINEIKTSSWFSQIDYAIKALIQQYHRYTQNKNTDWRIPIDTLSIRFEGFLRGIVGELNGQTKKIDRNNNTPEILLDGLLRDQCLLQIFTEDDIDFFEFVLTSKYLNIRNNVAHSFYIPQDYGITYATLVFLCILRLTKITEFRDKNIV